MQTLVDLLNGVGGAQLWAGLSQAPLVGPPRLADFVPATFIGYANTPLIVTARSPYDPGWGCFAGDASFVSLVSRPVGVTGLWITAIHQGTLYLVKVIDLAGTDGALILPGTNTFSVSLAAHVIVRA